MDNLERCVHEAIEVGMSYGHYMAQKITEEDLAVLYPNITFVKCAYCGNTIKIRSKVGRVRKYCDDVCRNRFYERKRAKGGEPGGENRSEKL